MDESETVVYHEKHGSGDGGDRVPGSASDVDIDFIKYFIINKLLIFISTSRTLPLDFRLAGDTLRFGPCVPSGWLGYEITYRHRSATYRVRVENPAGPGCGVRSVTVDGRPAPDGSVPLRDDG